MATDNSMDNAIDIVRRLFQKYYSSVSIPFPENGGMREFGFINFRQPGMSRHISFESSEQMMTYFRSNAPQHAYYSTAFYSRPSAPMDSKEWKGADLIFDIDCDHIPEVKDMSFEKQIETAKEKVIILLYDYLLGDMGFDKKYIEAVFSGGRGYHIHYRSPEFHDMGTRERREIVDYITGNGLKAELLFHEAPDKFGEGVGSVWKVPKPYYQFKSGKKINTGWHSRVYMVLFELLKKWSVSEPSQLIKDLKELEGVGKTGVDNFYEKLAKNNFFIIKDKYGEEVLKEELQFPPRFKAIRLLEYAVNIARERYAGIVDEPVTTDIKRIIRLPYSLHGKSGFKTQPIEIKNLDKFDPFNSALPEELGDRYVKVIGNIDDSVVIKGHEYKFIKNSSLFVPLYLVPHLILRGYALPDPYSNY